MADLSEEAQKQSTAPTITDVAKLAGVSKKTVSRFINNSSLISERTREKVAEAVSALSYVPNQQARGLALRRNFLIALLHDNPNAQTVLNFQKGVLKAIGATDLALVVRPVDRGSDDLLADIEGFLTKHRPLGVLLLPPISERDDIAELCKQFGIDYVRVGSALLDDDRHCVASNDCAIVKEMISALIERGHERIGFVRGPENFRSPIERENGFRAALEEAGIDFDPDLLSHGNYRFESGLNAGRELLSRKPRPTAIFASNDEMCAGVMHAAYEYGLSIPNDLAVVGFDNSPTAQHVWPPLSTVHWPIEEMGQLAASKLVASIQSTPEIFPDPDHVIVPSSIVERGSASLFPKEA